MYKGFDILRCILCCSRSLRFLALPQLPYVYLKTYITDIHSAPSWQSCYSRLNLKPGWIPGMHYLTARSEGKVNYASGINATGG